MRLTFFKSNRKPRTRRKKSRAPLDWQDAADITSRIRQLVSHSEFSYVNPDRIVCFRSTGAKTRAYARIWGLSRIFQQAFGYEPAYVIEVISEKFDRLSEDQKDHVLIHELMHIPKSFSGALVPHKHKGGVNERRVHEIHTTIKSSK